jgi:hypothetical protein
VSRKLEARAPTPAAASGVIVPGNTASRSASRRSWSSSRSQLQATTARSVRCRGSAVRLPPVGSWNRSPKRAATCSTGSARTRAAASSIASGSPSSRRQISTTAVTLSWVTAKPGWTATARSANSRTTGWAMASPAEAPGSGRPSGGTGHRASPRIPSGSRLVASTRSLGQRPSRLSTSRAAASITCSQLSSTSSVWVADSASTRRLIASRGMAGGSSNPTSRRPSALVTACGTSPGSVTAASSTSHAPPGTSSAILAATVVASRVFPAPPGPTSVTRRPSLSCLSICACSCSRPTKLVRATRRLPRGRVPLGRSGTRSPRRTARCASRSSGPGSVPSSSASSLRNCS